MILKDDTLKISDAFGIKKGTGESFFAQQPSIWPSKLSEKEEKIQTVNIALRYVSLIPLSLIGFKVAFFFQPGSKEKSAKYFFLKIAKGARGNK